MADLFELSDLQVDDVAGNGPGDPVTDSILTGDLRRKYSFGSGTSDLVHHNLQN